MPLKSRKRKVAEDATGPSKTTDPDVSEPKDTDIIGGMKGDYRISGAETSSEYESFTIPSEKDKQIPCQSRGTSNTAPDLTTLIFTHGAGGGLDNPATKLFAEGYASTAPCVCFEGTMNLQSRVKSIEIVLEHLQTEEPKRSFAVGGRSMGARAAVILAQSHDEVQKLVLVSYPLTSPKGDMRDKILLDLSAEKEVLFIIGSKDSMCDLEDLQKVMKKMKATSKLLVVNGADHGMSLSSGVSGKNKAKAIEELRVQSGVEAAAWIKDAASIEDKSELSWSNEASSSVFTGRAIGKRSQAAGDANKKRKKG